MDFITHLMFIKFLLLALAFSKICEKQIHLNYISPEISKTYIYG